MKQQTQDSSYSLRLATLTDLDAIKRMCRAFFSESIYKDKEYDEDKIHETILELLLDPVNRLYVLGIHEGRPVAQLAATVTPILFNKSRVATEVLWWVDGDHRRSGLGIKLIEAFEYWAKNIAKTDYMQLCSLNGDMADPVGKYYEKIGFKLIEKAYLKPCQQ